MSNTKITFKRKVMVTFFALLMMCISMFSMYSLSAGAVDTEPPVAESYSAEITPMVNLSTDSFNGLDGIKNFIERQRPTILAIAGAIAVICIIFAGICFMFGRSGSQIAKGWLLNILIGVFVISAGSFLIALFSGN